MAKVASWIGEFIQGREDLKKLRETNFLEFLKLLNNDIKEKSRVK